MAFIIKGKDDKNGFYTGKGWDADKGKAKQYPNKDAAAAIIAKHNMPATVEDSDDTAEQPADGPDNGNGGPE